MAGIIGYPISESIGLPNRNTDVIQGMTFGERLKRARKHAKLTQVQLAQRAKVSQSVISDAENGKAEGSSSVVKFAAVCGVRPEWLADGLGAMVEDEPSVIRLGPDGDTSPLVFVGKVTGAHLSAGSGEVIWDVDEVQKSHGFREDYMRERGLRPERCKVWSIKGDSMEPRYRDGGIVLIDMSDRQPAHGKVFALIGEDGLRVKQLRRGASGWEMHSFNPDQASYPPEPIVSENYAIIGRVKWYGGDED